MCFADPRSSAQALTLHHTLLLTHHGNLPPIASSMIFEFAEPLVPAEPLEPWHIGQNESMGTLKFDQQEVEAACNSV